jgi:hypothetical protein
MKEDQTSETSERLAYATGQLSEFQQLISFADAKSGAAITLASALVTVLFASSGSVPGLLGQPGKLWLGVGVLVPSAAVFGTFVVVLHYTFQTFLPRMEKSESVRSVGFFLDVFNTGEEPFIQEVSAMPMDVLLEHTLREVYLLSKILVAKFAAQRRCFQWLRIFLIFWAVAQVAVLLAQ